MYLQLSIRSPELKTSSEVPKHIGLMMEKEGGISGASGHVPVESLPSIIKTLASQDNGKDL